MSRADERQYTAMSMDLSTPDGRRQQGQRIQSACEEAGLSLEELARHVGCSRALLYQYISGVTLAQPDKVQRIAEAVGRPLSWFYTSEGEAASPAPAPPLPAPVVAAAVDPPAAPALPVPAGSAGREQHPSLAESLARLEELAAAYASPPDAWKEIATGEQIVSLARAVGDRDSETRALLRVGNAQVRLGELEAARRSLEQALAACDRLPGAEGRAASCVQSLGGALLGLGHIEAARAQFQRATRCDDWWGRWQGVLSLGAVHEQLGDYANAIAAFAEAARVADAGAVARDRQLAHLYIRANLINVHLAAGDYGPALEGAETCLVDAEALADAGQAIEALLNASLALLGQARWWEAEQRCRRALQLANLAGGLAHVAAARSCLALVLAGLGQIAPALQTGKDALDGGLRTGVVRCELLAHHALADAYLRSDTPREAHYHAERGAARAEALCHAHAAAQMRAQEGEALGRLGAYGRARDVLEHALDRAVGAGMRPVQGNALLSLSLLALDEGDAARARERAAAARDLAVEIGAGDQVWRARWAMGRALPTPAEKIEEWRAAVRAIEALRTRTRNEAGEESVLEEPDRLAAYCDLVQALRAAGRAADANTLIDEAHWPPLADACAAREQRETRR